MKKLMIIGLVILIAGSFSNLKAQSIAGLRSKVERLEKKIGEQQKKVEQAAKKVLDKIEKDKEEAKDNPHDHGTNDELNELREDLKNEEKKLEDLKVELEKTKRKLEEKLRNAVDDILKKNPIPSDPDELDDYEKKMKELKTSPRNSKTEAELRKRIQKRIDAKRKEMEEHGALPGSQNNHNDHGTSNWQRISHEEFNPSSSEWALGLEYSTWFSDGQKFPEVYFEDIKKEVYSNPRLTEQLMEKLGGEFHIGTLSGSEQFTNYEYKQPQFIGITGDFWLNEHFALRTGIAKGKSSASAEFPVTVFDFSDGSTEMSTEVIMGKIKNSQNIYEAYVYAQYAMFVHVMRILIAGGLDYDYYAASELEANIEGEKFTFQSAETHSTISPRAQLGLQLKLGQKVYLQADLKAKYVEEKIETGIGVGLQYRLGKK